MFDVTNIEVARQIVAERHQEAAKQRLLRFVRRSKQAA